MKNTKYKDKETKIKSSQSLFIGTIGSSLVKRQPGAQNIPSREEQHPEGCDVASSLVITLDHTYH